VRQRLLLASGVAFVLSAGSPLAAPIDTPPPLWTGCYAGLNAGWSWGNGDQVNTTTAATPIDNEGASLASLIAHTDANGVIGGGQFGCNYQWGPNFVFGIETDLQGAGINGEAHAIGSNGFLTATTSTTTNLYMLGTIRGRVGFPVSPNLLAYGTGGLAFGGVEADIYQTLTINNTPFFANSGHSHDLLAGWAAGGGLEWFATPNWSFKGEILYYDLGHSTYIPVSLPSTIQSATQIHSEGFILRAGVNFHFESGNPPY
jgi:outer membrane immunogenic protein